jgi:uncharacterized protein (TIGR02145 family)
MPKSEDWKALVNYAGGEKIAGGRLKSSKPTGSNCPWSDNGCGTDNFNFNALPGGYAFYWGEIFGIITEDDAFREIGESSYWWVDTQEQSEAYYWFFRTEDSEARTYFSSKDMTLAYVRCLHYGGD